MRAESTKCRALALVVRLDFDPAPVLAHALVLHVALDHREQRVVAAEADTGSGSDLGPALADDDGAGVDELAAEDLHAEHLRVRVASVTRRAAALLVCQLLGLLLRAPGRWLLGLGLLFGRRLGGGRLLCLRSGASPALGLGRLFSLF